MKIVVSAGEVSGDYHGSYLVKELLSLNPHLLFLGLGSERLAAAGVDVRFDISRRGTIGLFEALPNILPVYFIFLKMKRLILEEKPDLVLLIDSQGFNVPLARFCKKAGIKTAYYIPPHEWLWGTPKGARLVAEAADLIVAIFEKERDSYRAAGANVVYFGHPLVDLVRSALTKSEARKLIFAGEPDIIPDRQKTVISICPGSRTQEIKGLLPLLLKSAALIAAELPDARFLIPAASRQIRNDIDELVRAVKPSLPNLKVLDRQPYDALIASDLAICASGTINLEASILGVPNIMVYKLSPLTFFVGKYLLRIADRLKYFSMPNILLNECVVPELTMSRANPKEISREAIYILRDQGHSRQIQNAFSRLRASLGSPGVIRRCAQAILNFT